MRYAFIAQHAGQYPVTRLCSVLGVSRRGYYDWLRRPESARSVSNRKLLREIWRVFLENRQVYGAPRIHRVLQDEDHACGLNRVARLMRTANIVPKTIRKFRITTDSQNTRNPAENVLCRDFATDRPNQKWVADVTYTPTREGWLYFAGVLDLYSRRIVGWSTSRTLNSELAQSALRNAIIARDPPGGLLVHSDRGKEYYSKGYQAMLRAHDMESSMSRQGDCYDNAVMESFFHSLKTELTHHEDYRTRREARASLFDYVELFYNRRRKHSSIDYGSPVDFEESLAA